MRVELLAVGTELLLGDIVNTNAAWLGQRLAAGGLDVRTSVVVGDNLTRIAAAVRAGLGRADTLVVTGGLGPTQDDLTREALAEVAGVDLLRDAEIEDRLRERYAGLGRVVPVANYRQADLPRGARALPNSRGTAPGLCLEVGAGVVYALPGVPHEMEAMFLDVVQPELLVRAGQPATIVSRTLRTAGMWESAVAEALADLVTRLDEAGNPTIAFLAGGGEVRVRVTAKAGDRSAAVALLEPVEAAARARLGSAVYGVDDDTLPGVLARLLLARGATVAAAESLTGGLLGARLSETAGSSATYRGSVVAYASDLKAALLGVPEPLLAARGPVDPAVAEQMATGARKRLGAAYGVALTGVAGPDSQAGVQPGTVYVGLSGPRGTSSRRLRLPGDRRQIRELAVVAALDALRRELLREAGEEPER